LRGNIVVADGVAGALRRARRSAAGLARRRRRPGRIAGLLLLVPGLLGAGVDRLILAIWRWLGRAVWIEGVPVLPAAGAVAALFGSIFVTWAGATAPLSAIAAAPASFNKDSSSYQKPPQYTRVRKNRVAHA